MMSSRHFATRLLVVNRTHLHTTARNNDSISIASIRRWQSLTLTPPQRQLRHSLATRAHQRITLRSYLCLRACLCPIVIEMMSSRHFATRLLVVNRTHLHTTARNNDSISIASIRRWQSLTLTPPQRQLRHSLATRAHQRITCATVSCSRVLWMPAASCRQAP